MREEAGAVSGWARERGVSVPAAAGERANRTPRCHQGSEPLRGSCSRAGGPSQRARPLARALLVTGTNTADGSGRGGAACIREGTPGG